MVNPINRYLVPVLLMCLIGNVGAQQPQPRNLSYFDQISIQGSETRFCRCQVDTAGRINGRGCDLPSEHGSQAIVAQWLSMRQLASWVETACTDSTRHSGMQRAQCDFIEGRVNRAWAHPVNQVLAAPGLRSVLDQHIWDLSDTVEFSGYSLGYEGCGIAGRVGSTGLMLPSHARGDFARVVFFLVSRYNLPLPGEVIRQLDVWDYEDPINGLELRTEQARWEFGVEHNPLILDRRASPEAEFRYKLTGAISNVFGSESR